VIRVHEVDQHNLLTVPALLMLMQEGSMHNAIDLGFSLWDEDMANTSWVLLRKELVVYKMPKLGDTIRIVTYPAGIQRVFAYRDFWAIDSEGNTLAYAGSTWTLMNLLTRKISPIPRLMFELQEVDKGEKLPIPAQRLNLSKEFEMAYKYRIGHYDLDWNGHVNNVVMARLLLQGVPLDVHANKRLSSFRIHVKSEILPGQRLIIEQAKIEDAYHLQLKGEDDNVLAAAISEWA